MKHLILTCYLVFVTSVSAQVVGQNTSSACFRLSSWYMPANEGQQYCSEVANNCFNAFIESYSFYQSRDNCFNVSASCFKEVILESSITVAAMSCMDVNSKCYHLRRSQGLSAKESIELCSGVTSP